MVNGLVQATEHTAQSNLLSSLVRPVLFIVFNCGNFLLKFRIKSHVSHTLRVVLCWKGQPSLKNNGLTALNMRLGFSLKTNLIYYQQGEPEQRRSSAAVSCRAQKIDIFE